MRRADASARQHRYGSFGNHRHVDGDLVTLGNAFGLKDVGEFGDFAEHLGVGNGAGVTRLTFPNNRGFIATTLLDLVVKRVVSGVGFAAHEPLYEGLIPVGQGVPFLKPVQLVGDTTPESFGVIQGLAIKGLILLECIQLRLALKIVIRRKPTRFLQDGFNMLGHTLSS